MIAARLSPVRRIPSPDCDINARYFAFPSLCGIGYSGGRFLSLGDYVAGQGPWTEQPLSEGANVVYALGVSGYG